MKISDISGRVFGKLTAVSLSHTENNRAWWFCSCGCGKEKIVLGKHLRSGQVTSCGCGRGSEKKYEDYKARRAELKSLNPDKAAEYTRAYRKRHQEKVMVQNRNYSSLYRSKRRGLKSKPIWFDKEKVDFIYKKARLLSMEVDHIVPLLSDIVCGLHTWENLQLLEMKLNRSKSNKTWPDMP